jgi:uncharacterized protein (DUF305 family)
VAADPHTGRLAAVNTVADPPEESPDEIADETAGEIAIGIVDDPPPGLPPIELADEIVLPWWQNPINILVLIVSAALIGGMAGWVIGDAQATPDPNEVDVGFLQDMREHHEQAVAMSFIYLQLDDTHPGLRSVARSIAFGQGIEIGRMIQLLRDFGEPEANQGDTAMTWMGMSAEVGRMPGMASDDELDALGASSGPAADRLYVQLMTAHHEGGIEMADFAAGNAGTAEVRDMARAMAEGQRDEIVEMTRLVD